MSDIIKSNHELTNMARILNEEAERLPATSFFGDDNTQVKEESRAMARELLLIAKTGELPADTSEKVKNWVTGAEWSELEDYESAERED